MILQDTSLAADFGRSTSRGTVVSLEACLTIVSCSLQPCSLPTRYLRELGEKYY